MSSIYLLWTHNLAAIAAVRTAYLTMLAIFGTSIRAVVLLPFMVNMTCEERFKTRRRLSASVCLGVLAVVLTLQGAVVACNGFGLRLENAGHTILRC